MERTSSGKLGKTQPREVREVSAFSVGCAASELVMLGPLRWKRSGRSHACVVCVACTGKEALGRLETFREGFMSRRFRWLQFRVLTQRFLALTLAGSSIN
jgi:hypothetical protein